MLATQVAGQTTFAGRWLRDGAGFGRRGLESALEHEKKVGGKGKPSRPERTTQGEQTRDTPRRVTRAGQRCLLF